MLGKLLTALGIDGITVRIKKREESQESCIQEHLFKHFNSMGHNGFVINVSITLIDKTNGKNPKKREDYWRETLKTYSSFGLNIEGSV